MPKKNRIDQFRPQSKNANRHRPRGMQALDTSIATDGWIGAITTAADGETFDGSARLETVYTRFGDEVDPIVFEIDGTRPVVLKRIDIPTAEDPKAKRLAISANRIAQLNLEFDPEVLAELTQEIDLSGFWTDDELKDLLSSLGDVPEDAEGGDRESGRRNSNNEIECECPKCGCTFTKNIDAYRG